MRAHVIENGVVVNTIEVESLDFLPGLVDADNGGKIGDLYQDGQFTTPEPDPEIAIAANAAQAKRLLEESDWSDLPSVRNTAISPHLLNGADFDAYRAALRAIVVNRPATVESWPVRPDAAWSTAA